MSQSQVIEYAVGLTFYYQVTARVCVRVCTRARLPPGEESDLKGQFCYIRV